MRLWAKGSLTFSDSSRNTIPQDMPHAVAQPQRRRPWSDASLQRWVCQAIDSAVSSKWIISTISMVICYDLFVFGVFDNVCRFLWMISSGTMQRSLRETLLEYMQVRGSDWWKGWKVLFFYNANRKSEQCSNVQRICKKPVWSQAMNK